MRSLSCARSRARPCSTVELLDAPDRPNPRGPSRFRRESAGRRRVRGRVPGRRRARLAGERSATRKPWPPGSRVDSCGPPTGATILLGRRCRASDVARMGWTELMTHRRLLLTRASESAPIILAGKYGSQSHPLSALPSRRKARGTPEICSSPEPIGESADALAAARSALSAMAHQLTSRSVAGTTISACWLTRALED